MNFLPGDTIEEDETFEKVYDADGITLYAGRCEHVLPTLLEPVDAIMADLPYGTTRNDWDRKIDPKILWHLYNGLRGDRTPVLLFGSGIFTAEMTMSNTADWKYDLVWDKDAITGQLNAKKQPLRAHENISVFYRAAPFYDPQMVYTGRSSHGRGTRKDRTVNHYGAFENTETVDQQGYQYPRSILKFRRPKAKKGEKLHATAKPVELMEWMIKSYTKPGDLVLDNTCGSSSTLVAARNCGRRAIGIEVDEVWVQRSIERLNSGNTGDHYSVPKD